MAKTHQQIKREKNREKRTRIEKTTNWYMVNLAWGIFTIILIRMVENGYDAGHVFEVQNALKIFAGVFAVIAVGLFVCGKLNLLNRKHTFVGYGVFSGVLALGSLWEGYFAQIRNVFVNINPLFGGFDSSWWFSKLPIAIVVAYLVAALVWTAVRIACLEKGKIK